MGYGIPLTNAAAATASVSTKVLSFPEGAVADNSLVMKEGAATRTNAAAAAFKTAFDTSHTVFGWESVSLASAADTTEQTLANVTGAGILTLVVHPQLSAGGTATIRITADGVLTTLVSETLATGDRFYAGDVRQWDVEITADGGGGLGSDNDSGFGTASTGAAAANVMTPLQTIMDGQIGIKFTATLLVTIQGSVNLHATAANRSACCAYYLNVPKGY